MQDLRGTATWNRVHQYFTEALGPAFGTVSRLAELTATADGSRIAGTGFVLDGLEGVPRQVVALVEDGAVRSTTEGPSSSRLPRFSPYDGTLAYLSDRAESGRFQLFVNDMSTPDVPGTVESFAWSPDGTNVLLAVAGLGADLAGGQGSGTTYKPEEELPSWMPRVDEGISEDAWRSVWVYDVRAQQVRQLSPAGLNVWEAVWLGNAAVLAVTSPRPDEGAWYTAVLSRIGLDGTVSEVTSSPVQLGLPAGSPDGGLVAVVQAVCSDRWIVAGDLLVGPPGELEAVDTAGVDITCTQWIDADRLGILGIRGLETVAATYDRETGKVTELWSSLDSSSGFRYPDGLFLADGSLLAVVEGYHLPQQVTALPEGSVLACLAHPGSDSVLALNGTAENVEWTAPDGLRIEGILCRPEGDGPFPLVVCVHGGPVWAYRNLWSMFYAWTPLLVSQGYAVLNPNPRGSGGRGQDFARQVFGDMGGADTGDFLSGIDAMVTGGVADPQRIAVMGGSYGGFMAAWLVTQDQRFAAAVPLSPVTDWYSQHFTSNIPYFDALFLDGNPEVPGDKFHSRSPVAHASKAVTPCLNVAGALDRCTPPGQAEEFHRALLEHGVPSSLVVYPEEGHGVRAFPAQIDLCTRILDFYAEHL
jgi:dipeptidyl aminopeptidase/acylaminoacyl peptidase